MSIDLAASSVEAFNGDAGNDTAYGAEAAGPLTLRGNAGDDVTTGGSANDNLDGGIGNDRLIGGAGIDTFSGGSGNDTLYVDMLDVAISGGAGMDTVIMTRAGALTLHMASTSNEIGFGGGGADTLSGIGSTVALTLQGNAGSDILEGGNAADLIGGGTGEDTLFGGAGADVLSGGIGADVFVYGRATLGNPDVGGGIDRITDFNVAEDSFYLDSDIFNALWTTGVLEDSDFYAGALSGAYG